jgi:hypothetical protein|tara:strand:- start:52 stop:690 length:639 start_codon:yes stop_codon:yes gene_type:complete
MAELRVKSTGTLKLFENDNTSSVTIASPASLGGDRTVTLPDASVTLASGTMLATDGDGSSLTGLPDNTPSFRVRLSGNQSIANASATKITFDTEDWDTDSAFASNKFTVPVGSAGKYYLNLQTMVAAFDGSTTSGYFVVNYIYLNGAVAVIRNNWMYYSSGGDFYDGTTSLLDLAEGDYIEGYVYQSNASTASKDLYAGSAYTFLEGFKLIG